MEALTLHLLSTYLKKWSYQENKISISYSFFSELGYERNMVDMRINSPQIMANEFLNNLIYKAKDIIYNTNETEKSPLIKLYNEAEVQRKLSLFLSKILKEFNTNKRSRGRMRMISSRSMDFYYNDYEYEPAEDSVKFYIHLNRGVNKMNGDLWAAAIEELNQALEYNPEHPLANKYLAEAYLKSQQIEEALPYFKKYAEIEQSPESLNHLGHAFIKMGEYEEAIKIFDKIKTIEPDSLLAKIGQAQVAYLRGKPYAAQLDRIGKIDIEWLREYLKSEWVYKIPGYGEDESKMWNAAVAARYLGYERPFDLTKRAFNDELPCYFDSERGTIRFVKAELDNWILINNRFKLDGVEYEVYKDRLSEKELEIGNIRRKRLSSKRKVLKHTNIPSSDEDQRSFLGLDENDN
jgi:tetratricopeptide (TPR) repeat protein